jgi:hypothetical protein
MTEPCRLRVCRGLGGVNHCHESESEYLPEYYSFVFTTVFAHTFARFAALHLQEVAAGLYHLWKVGPTTNWCARRPPPERPASRALPAFLSLPLFDQHHLLSDDDDEQRVTDNILHPLSDDDESIDLEYIEGVRLVRLK